MAENDIDALMRRVQKTLNAASLAVSRDKDWFDRVRSNWGSDKKIDPESVKSASPDP